MAPSPLFLLASGLCSSSAMADAVAIFPLGAHRSSPSPSAVKLPAPPSSSPVASSFSLLHGAPKLPLLSYPLSSARRLPLGFFVCRLNLPAERSASSSSAVAQVFFFYAHRVLLCASSDSPSAVASLSSSLETHRPLLVRCPSLQASMAPWSPSSADGREDALGLPLLGRLPPPAPAPLCAVDLAPLPKSGCLRAPSSFSPVIRISFGRSAVYWLTQMLDAQSLRRVHPLLFLFAGRSSQPSVPSLRRAPSRRSSLPSSFSALPLVQHRLLLLVDATLPSFDAAP
ncbi:uncharacterized protein [Zea mays]|jgi:hypothetical protein|uniref:Uncharacterized protein n=1 Tax=Zea mays TaxID=4577 RepID=A0A804MMS8_MAIZE|nr:uncharacterized protein LOC103647366 [Zea mays]|eukprot:XP_008670133.1 uncharacterized protein LOC103647366 [Zea mays]